MLLPIIFESCLEQKDYLCKLVENNFLINLASDLLFSKTLFKGTFIASNQRFKWYWLATAGSAVLAFTLIYGWTINDGDITFGRLNKIPYQTIQWYHACAPLILVLLTRGGIPVSTTFLVLSAFASTVNKPILEKKKFLF